MKAILRERTERMVEVFPALRRVSSLYGEILLPRAIFLNLSAASKFAIYDSLISFYAGEAFDADLPIEAFCRKYKRKIFALPNITPNGLVMPKAETLNSANFLNKSVFDLIEFLGLKDQCEIACPVNLRLNFGIHRSKDVNARPKSSTNWHTDIWAGQNANELMIHTPIFGDFDENGIAVALPPAGFYPDFVKALSSFKDGTRVTDGLNAVAQKPRLMPGKSYIFDSFLLHKTVSMGSDMRGIISFPIKLKRTVPSDIYRNPLRDDEYIPYAEWKKMGRGVMLVSEKKIRDKPKKDESSNVYADTFLRIPILKP